MDYIAYESRRFYEVKYYSLHDFFLLLGSTNMFYHLISSNYWEKKPKLIKRSESKDYYSNLLSTKEINSMLKDNYVEYTKNVDITSYKDGVRETLNPEGRVVSCRPMNFKLIKTNFIFTFRQHPQYGTFIVMVVV